MKKLFFIPALTAILLTSCYDINTPDTTSNQSEATPISLTSEQQVRVTQDNEFAIDLLKQTISVSGDQNVIVSPLSVSMALGMTWNGANGNTKTEMETALKMSGLSEATINSYYKIMQSTLPSIDPATKVSLANSIWYKTGFPVKQSFLNVNTNFFNSYIKELDFTQSWAKDSINNWCAKKTNNLIPSIVDNIPPEAVMYLVNAVYFKGTWTKKFDKNKTYETTFTNEQSQVNSINMMSATDSFPYLKDNVAQYVDLPYGNKAYSMTVILPLAGKSTSDVLSALTPTRYKEILNSFTKQKVILAMPRFKTGCKYLLNTELQNMGMHLAFSAGSADLTGIANAELYINNVIHKTEVEVTEEGTEAAAVTAVEVGTTSIEESNAMLMNKPFIFVIREKSTGVILFAAKMGNIEKY